MVSHTTTGEWQSFEVRMRRRRAERLVLRAEAAVEAGCLDDAQTCVAEARSLAPDLPALEAIERRLSPVPAPEADQLGPTRSRMGTAAAAILALISIGVLILVAWPIVQTRDVQTDAVPVAAQSTVPAPAVEPNPAAAPPSTAPPSAATAETPDTTPPPLDPTLLTAPAEKAVATVPAPEPVQRDVVSVASAEEPRPRVPAIDPLPSAESMPGRVTVPAPPPAPVASVPTSAGVLPLPDAAIPPPAAPPAPEPSQVPAVRSVLERYASAYSALDVEATQRVWPGVNRGALSRAFDSLASQEVSLGNCRIDVSGANAMARCTGSAAWTPKIGDGGRHSEAREWTFELARRGAGWEIVNARVQNR